MDLTGVLGEMALAAGALGTAAFGIVEALKWTPLGEAGFGNIRKLLGDGLMNALKVAYGDDYEKLLRAQYRKNSGTADLARTLRQGVRIGLTEANAAQIAEELKAVSAPELTTATQRLKALTDDESLDKGDLNVIGRYELAADARIGGALTLAQDSYVGALRFWASVVAIGMSLLAALVMDKNWFLGLIVGVAAVPLAPIANDVVGALNAATRALERAP